MARQIVKLTNEVSLDLYFVEGTAFEPPRKLRTDPLLGYVMYNSLPLFETQHFFEYTQAIVRAGFDDTANVLTRARKHSLPSRELWMELTLGGSSQPQDVLKYLRAVYHAANAVAGLNGPSLTDRRFLLDFEDRARIIGRPELHDALLNLLGAPSVAPADLLAMLPAWSTAYHAAGDGADLFIHPDRVAYHRNALEALLQGDQPLLRCGCSSTPGQSRLPPCLNTVLSTWRGKRSSSGSGWWAMALKGRSRRWTASWTKPRKCWTPYLPRTVCPDPPLAVYFGGFRPHLGVPGTGMNRPLSPILWISAYKLWRNDSVCGQIAQVFEFFPPTYGGMLYPPPMGGRAVYPRPRLWKNYPFFLPLFPQGLSG